MAERRMLSLEWLRLFRLSLETTSLNRADLTAKESPSWPSSVPHEHGHQGWASGSHGLCSFSTVGSSVL